MSGTEVLAAESTEKFVGPADAPLQLARVAYTGCTQPSRIRIDGDGLAGEATTDVDGGTVEIAVAVDNPAPGQRRAARAHAAEMSTEFTFTVAEPGWTMFMVGHFHYDPVWWNTQANYTSAWAEDPPGACRQANGIDLVRAHLDWARREPEYKFALAEVDYLKPFWDTHPEHRVELRRLIREGRVEVLGGAYNEPSTTLVGPETTIRNLVHGSGFQRGVMGLGHSGPAGPAGLAGPAGPAGPAGQAGPVTAWQLDVFGHDPQFPGMAADAGLTAGAWARGPYHQWGPMAEGADPRCMQFPSEFEWVAPSGRGLLTHYMPAHYAAGWWMDSSTTLTEAEDAVYRLFTELKKVALTRNVLLPVGTDFTPPNRWVTKIHRDWAARYTWPKFVCALPREFFAAVRAELHARGASPSPQTRDMNPIYTGTYVSYIDTKQANRAAEQVVLDAERFAVFAALLTGAGYPQAALDKAWAQLAFCAHHDAITGSESDQVYLDLLTSWRDAWQLGRSARDGALTALSGAVTGGDGPCLVVWNPVGRQRTDVVTAHLETPPATGVRVLDGDGVEVPAHVEDGGRTISWLARDVPSLGWRTYRLAGGRGVPAAGWLPVAGTRISNEHYRLTADPSRGGGIVSLEQGSRELIAAGGVGNELVLYDEYAVHPKSGEGPWHLVPNGPVVGSATVNDARVQAYRGPLGERLVVRGRIGRVLTYTQTLTLWRGVARVDCRTTIDEFTGSDVLLRLRWPCPVPGAMPVAEVGDAVIGRGFGLLHDESGRSVDAVAHPWTLDTAAHRWFGLSSAVRVRVGDGVRAVSVADVVTPGDSVAAPVTRQLMVALVRAGVTATRTDGDGPRYGHLAVDSNLPDTRIALGGPDRNPFTKAVLESADPAYGAELDRQLGTTGWARVWVPAAAPLAAVWVAGADLRDPRALPVLVVAGCDDAALAVAVTAVAEDLAEAEIVVTQQPPSGLDRFEGRTVALLNRGVPGFAVETDGTLHTALLRSCTGWPSAAWTDAPRRTVPDGTGFQLQHWTHVFDYALVSGDGDWRRAEIPSRSAEFAGPLVAVPAGGKGGLPATGSLLCLGGDGAVELAALKATGNPLAQGSARAVDPADITLRLVETHGRDATVTVDSDVGRVRLLGRADLLERPSEHPHPDRLHGYEIATLTARVGTDPVADPTPDMPDAEAAQPLYARYWLHNRGPAPLGGLPAVAHLHPQRVSLDAGALGNEVTLRLTVASDCTDASLRGTVVLICPPGWVADPPKLPVTLPPGEHLAVDVALRVPPDIHPGLYPVRAQLAVTGDDLPPAWRQVVEDVCAVSVGSGEDRLLYLVDAPADVAVAAGDTARLAVTVGTDARADLAVEAHLISPWGTWEWTGQAALGAVLPARGVVDLQFEVSPPVWTQPGTWWALVRVGCAGRLVYSPAVRLTVR